MLALSRTARTPRPASALLAPHRRSESLTTHEVFNTSHPDVRPGELQPGSSQPPKLPGHGQRKQTHNPLLAYDVPLSDDPDRRPERRSPAAAFGARKMPRISLPSELENKLERLVGQQDMALTKRCFQLFLPPPDVRRRNPQALAAPKRSASTNLVPRDPAKQKVTSAAGRVLDLTLQPLKAMPRQTTAELVVAHAAAELPTQYAVLRTLMREVQSRNGWDVPGQQGGIQIVDFASGYGATAWAAVATLPSPPEKKNALVLLEPSELVGDFSKQLLRLDTPGPLATWATLHFRSFHRFRAAGGAPRLQTEKSVGVLAFALASLPTPAERRRKLRELWHSGVETMVVCEQGHRDGWTVVEEAREFLLGIGRDELATAREQAGDYVPPAPKPTEEEIVGAAAAAAATAAAASAPAPRPRGRRRPGERARPSLAAAAPEDAAADVDGAVAPSADGQFGIDHGPAPRKPERFFFNGVEFEESDARVDEAEAAAKKDKDVARWDEGGKQLVKDGRILGCHVLAPCPHDQKCPLAATPTPCTFGQLLETPLVTRLTKNVKSDLSRLSYSYFILRRGPRPAVVDEDRGEGRVGEVERELRLAREEKEGRTAVEGDDGVFALPDDAGAAAAAAGERAEADQVDYGKLRREIGEWGRVLRAPLHRKGHSEVDLCTAEGVVKRATFSKRLGKQVWYDAAQINEGDAFPHAPTSAVDRVRGVTHLAPAHKTNKVTVKNGVVDGLDKLGYVEWKEVRDMMAAMGVDLPEFESGKRPKNRRPVVEYSNEVEAREGWEAARKAERRLDPAVKDDVVRGILGGEEELADEPRADVVRETRLVPERAAARASWSIGGGGGGIDGQVEFEPTPLVGAREVVHSDGTGASSSSSLSSFSSQVPFDSIPPAEPSPAVHHDLASVFDDIVASQQGAPPAEAFSIAATTRVSLAGLGEGWMEEFAADVSPADRRAAARDRNKTFVEMGIPVPDLGQPRTLQDDWDLLEKWDGVATRQPKPKRSAFWNRTDWRTRKPRSQRATAAAAAAADGAAAPDAGGQ